MGTIMGIRRGGGSGCTLTVTGVAGDTATLTKGSKTYTKTFDSSGKAVFKGLSGGTWTAGMSNGTESTSRSVNIVADYAVTLAYFSATIAVTWPAGSTCTCANGSTVLTAPDTSGSYTFTVTNTGTWTVSCTNGTENASTTVSITADGQSATAKLAYDLVLYDSGDQYTDITGGWTGVGYTSSGAEGPGTLGDAAMIFNGDGTHQPTLGTLNSIDFTGYNTLCVKGTVESTGSTVTKSNGMFLAKAKTAFAGNNRIAQTLLPAPVGDFDGTTDADCRISLTGVTTSAYVVLRGNVSTDYRWQVTKVWATKEVYD
nr:MAG TPA: hypothetical protein [Caudoviricetes sp.]